MPASAERATRDGDESLRLLSLAERTLTGRLEEALRSCGSTLDQWRILRLLADRGGYPMNVVADHVLLLAPKLSKLVDRMVAANLILRRRDHEDRRRVLIVFSERGRRALAQWDEATTEVRTQFRDLLGADADQFEALLQTPAGRARPRRRRRAADRRRRLTRPTVTPPGPTQRRVPITRAAPPSRVNVPLVAVILFWYQSEGAVGVGS